VSLALRAGGRTVILKIPVRRSPRGLAAGENPAVTAGRAPRGRDILARFQLPLGLLAVAVVYGTLGYKAMGSQWGWVESLYQTVITLTTVGYREVEPLGTGGQLFTISLILTGLGAVFGIIAIGAELVASGELGAWYSRRRVDKRIAGLRDHHVICAYGRVGRAVAAELREQGAPFLVIDTDPGLVPLMDAEGIVHMTADPTSEEVLREAGITRARGLVCAVDSDAVNVFITLTARALAPTVPIVARASQAESVDKLMRAGADRVVSPYELSGRRMGFLVSRPAVLDFLDLVQFAPDLRLEEIIVRPGSFLEGRTVGDASRRIPGVVVLACKKGEELMASPAPDTPLVAGDLLVAMGPTRALEALLR
jgi:voltage-gated potassium channel